MIDADNREVVTLSMYTTNAGETRARLYIGDTKHQSAYISSKELSIDDYNDNGKCIVYTIDRGLFIGRTDESGLNITEPEHPYFRVAPYDNILHVIMKDLPTSLISLRSGELWNDNGTLRIVQ